MDKVVLTNQQTAYLATDPSAAPGDIPGAPETLVITDQDARGWIFVEELRTWGEEGSGVWVDELGQEHHGPVGG